MATLTAWKFDSPTAGSRWARRPARWAVGSPTPASTTTSSTPSTRRSRRGTSGDTPELIHSNLSDADEPKLREAFAEE